MPQLWSFLGLVAIALLPVGASAWFGYRYGYHQRLSVAGFVWRAVLLSAALSWSLVGGRSHDAAWGLFLPNLVVVVAFTGFAGAGEVAVLPPLWIAPLAHLVVFALAVRHGYRSKERQYTRFPSA